MSQPDPNPPAAEQRGSDPRRRDDRPGRGTTAGSTAGAATAAGATTAADAAGAGSAGSAAGAAGPTGEVGAAGSAGSSQPLLEISNMTVGYGRIEALHGISLTVDPGELVTLIGANGAGKTTTMRAISGILPLTAGKVIFDGRDITRMKAHQRVAAGIIQAPEGRGVFPGMTVQENLDMGHYARKFDSKSDYDESLERVYSLFPRLLERRKQAGGTMSGGEQQMLAIGRALMARPRLLLLDEPSMGLAPMIIQQIFRIISEINQQGTTILLVEQNAQQALSRSDRAYILETGEVIKTGVGKELLADPSVKEAYLGVGADSSAGSKATSGTLGAGAAAGSGGSEATGEQGGRPSLRR